VTPRMAWLRDVPTLWRSEPMLTGRVGGALYTGAGVYALLLLVLPGTTLTHPGLVAPLGAASALYGLLSLFVLDWRRLPAWALPAGTLTALVSTALAVYATGGFDSPVEQVPVFVVVYAACFLSSRFTALCVVAAVVAHELPLLYDAHARAQSIAADSLSAVLVFGSLGFVVVVGRALLARVSEEHAVMRELATAVASGMAPADVFVLASRRIAILLDVDGCGIIEFASSESAVIGGAWARGDAPALPPGTILPLARGDDLHRLYTEGRAVRVDRHGAAKRAAKMGYGCSLTTPVQVRGRLWGAISVASVAPDSLPSDAERGLDDFAELIGLAVANTEAHAVLVEQAATDPLTRLANHRSFHERLREELSRALRHGRPLALALLDVDHFKAINDSLGHERGDVVLAAVAATLSDVARTEHVLARLGGDEFALLMPETDERQALSPSSARAARSPRSTSPPGCGSPSRPASAASSTRAIRTRSCGSPTALCTGARPTDATPRGSTTPRSCASSRSPSAPTSCSARRRSSASARWRAPSTPRTSRPASTPSGSPRWRATSRATTAGPRTASPCWRTRRWSTTSARSASPTPCC
jgi:GAF domain-containing protein